MADKKIVFYRYFNVISFRAPKDDVRIPHIMAKRAVVHRRVATRERGRTYYENVVEPCYREEWCDKQLIYTVGVGLLEKLEDAFEAFGYETDMIDVEPAGIHGLRRLMPNLKKLESIKWRDDQRNIVDDILQRPHGQYQLSTGAGKSFMIPKLCEVFDKARIVITTVGIGLLQDMYHKMLQQGQVDVGICTSRNNDPKGRVLLCSLGTLSRFADEEFDVMFLDEKHECATLQRMQSLLSTNVRRAYGFSADDDNRGDNGDAWLEVLFGPTRQKITHIDSVRAGDIVPVRVNWVKVEDNRFKTGYAPGTDGFERHVYRDNPVRNDLVANTAKQVKSAGQTLVYVSKVEHAYRIRKLLDCPVAHAKRTPEQWDQLKQLGLVSPGEKPPTEDDMLNLRRRMSAGTERLAICNSVWRRGVDFPQLRSLVRADGSTSAIDATQISGRLTRKAEGKLCGELFDFADNFCEDAYRRAQRRRQLYGELNYQQSSMPK